MTTFQMEKVAGKISLTMMKEEKLKIVCNKVKVCEEKEHVSENSNLFETPPSRN